MLNCINKNSKEFRDLKEMSGLPESQLEAESRWFITNMDRFPYLDELDGADSEPHLLKRLQIGKDSTTSLETLFKITGKNTVDEALSELNNIYRDLEISGVVLNDGNIIINREHKPIKNRKDIVPVVTQDNIHSALIIDDISNKLSTLYGIPITPLTTFEINEDEQLSQIPDVGTAKAFIFNNNIYVNTDNATLDSKIHELMHILFGSMKYSNPDLYWNLVQTAETFSNFNDTARLYQGRTRGDILEEVFITELSRHLAGLNNAIQDIPLKEAREIFYQTHRLLDIAFMGDYSVKGIPTDQLYQLTLKQIGQYVNSALTNQSFKGSISDAEVSRILANKKSELIRDGKLKEYCG